MSFIKPKDFATLYGVKYSTLRSHIQRGRLVKENEHIDTDNPVNKIYIDEINSGNVQIKNTPSKKIKSTPTVTQFDEGKESPETSNITLRRKKAEALKAEREAELKQLQVQKLMGQLMPVEMVERIFTINIQTIFRTMENELENIASIYCDISGADRSHLTEMTTRMRESLQLAITTAKEKSSDEIESTILEYSETRSRGERK